MFTLTIPPPPRQVELKVDETKAEEEVSTAPQPLSQLITAFSRSATTELTELSLYNNYANIMSQVPISTGRQVHWSIIC